MRDKSISMAKGVAILLMVLVHARFSHYGDVYINMFHMPLFFFMSGYCFKTSYLDNFGCYLWKRIKGSYWPFVKWGLLFLLLHNFFFSLSIYNGEYGFRGKASSLYSNEDFIEHAKAIVTSMSGSEQLLGGYWFLHSYFIAAIICFFTIWLFRKKREGMLLCVGGGFLLIASVLFCKYSFSISRYLNATDLLAAFFMVFGYAYRQSKRNWEEHPLLVIPFGGVIVALGSFYWPSAMLKLEWIKIVPYAFSALAGTLMVFSFCKWLIKRQFLKTIGILSYVGDKTIDILTWHFLCFKMCSLTIIAIYSLPAARLAEFPVIEEYAYKGWWLPYFLIGVALSLAIAFVLTLIKELLNKYYTSIVCKK